MKVSVITSTVIKAKIQNEKKKKTKKKKKKKKKTKQEIKTNKTKKKKKKKKNEQTNKQNEAQKIINQMNDERCRETTFPISREWHMNHQFIFVVHPSPGGSAAAAPPADTHWSRGVWGPTHREVFVSFERFFALSAFAFSSEAASLLGDSYRSLAVQQLGNSVDTICGALRTALLEFADDLQLSPVLCHARASKMARCLVGAHGRTSVTLRLRVFVSCVERVGLFHSFFHFVAFFRSFSRFFSCRVTKDLKINN